MQSTANVTLTQSGFGAKIPNGLLNSTSISCSYVLDWLNDDNEAPSIPAPSAVSVSIEGVKNASGDSAVLDIFSCSIVTTPQNRTIALSDTYDYFLVTFTSTGGTNVSVFVTLTSASGSGPVFSAVGGSIANIHNQ